MANRRYSPFITAYGKWFKKYIQRLDWGFWSSDTNSPMPNIKNSEMRAYLTFGVMRKHWLIFTKTRLERHIDGVGTYYYRSDSDSGHALICFDIDPPKDKSLPNDAHAMAQYLVNRFHRKCYFEPSTHGRGAHLYCLFNTEGMAPRKFNELLNEYRRALRIIVSRKFSATLDRTCGNFSIVTLTHKGNTIYRSIEEGDRGILAKCPRLKNGFDYLKRLTSAPVQKVATMYRVIREAERLKQRAIVIPPAIPTLFSLLTTESQNQPTKVFKTLQEARTDTDAFSKTHFACSYFINLYRRLPYDEYELMNFYENHGLHTPGNADHKRLPRVRNVLKYQREHVKDEQLAAFGFRKDYYLGLIRKYVSGDAYADVWSFDRTVNEEDLAIVLYVMETNIFRTASKREWQFTTGNECIRTMFDHLKQVGVTDRGGRSLNKIVAAKNILVNAGLATELDPTWLFAGSKDGRCKKFGLGERHPRYEEYLEAKRAYDGEGTVEEGIQMPVETMPINYDYLFEDVLAETISAATAPPEEIEQDAAEGGNRCHAQNAANQELHDGHDPPI